MYLNLDLLYNTYDYFFLLYFYKETFFKGLHCFYCPKTQKSVTTYPNGNIWVHDYITKFYILVNEIGFRPEKFYSHHYPDKYRLIYNNIHFIKCKETDYIPSVECIFLLLDNKRIK